MTAARILERDAHAIITAVGVPPVRQEEFGGTGTIPELLCARLSELAEAYWGWCFDEAQDTELAVARAALDVERKAVKLLASLVSKTGDELIIRTELGPGSMYSFALLEGGEDPRGNLDRAVKGVQDLARWARQTGERAQGRLKRKASRDAFAEKLRECPGDAPALLDAWCADWSAAADGAELPAPLVTTERSSPDDRLLWHLAKVYYEFWKRKPGYSTSDASQEKQSRGGPFIRYLDKCMPLFGINLSADGYQKRWSRLVDRGLEESDWQSFIDSRLQGDG